MTDEAKALVERLRKNSGWRNESWQCVTDPTLLIESADLIETQAREIERLRVEAQAQYHRGYYDGRTALGDTK